MAKDSYSDVNDPVAWMLDVTRKRYDDISDFNFIQNNTPRIINRTPSSSSDVLRGEKVGDIAVRGGDFYWIEDNSGTLRWLKVTGSTF